MKNKFGKIVLLGGFLLLSGALIVSCDLLKDESCPTGHGRAKLYYSDWSRPNSKGDCENLVNTGNFDTNYSYWCYDDDGCYGYTSNPN